jgi:hypothetical protein
MGKLREHGSGDAPRLALSMQIGRYRITPTLPGKVWIMDCEGGEVGQSYDVAQIEAALILLKQENER